MSSTGIIHTGMPLRGPLGPGQRRAWLARRPPTGGAPRPRPRRWRRGRGRARRRGAWPAAPRRERRPRWQLRGRRRQAARGRPAVAGSASRYSGTSVTATSSGSRAQPVAGPRPPPDGPGRHVGRPARACDHVAGGGAPLCRPRAEVLDRTFGSRRPCLPVACEYVHEAPVRRTIPGLTVTSPARDRPCDRLLFSIVVSLPGRRHRQAAKRRPAGTPLTWGEAFVGGCSCFAFFLMIYGVVPDRWLRYADNELKWRTDKLGIPLGPLGHFLHDLRQRQAKNVVSPTASSSSAGARSSSTTRPSGTSSPRSSTSCSSAGSSSGPSGRSGARSRATSKDLAPGRPPRPQEGDMKRAMAKNDANPPHARLPRRVRPPGGRERLPGQGGQAQAVPPHRPVRVHHVRGLRRHLPVEVHPHALHRHHLRGGEHRRSPATTPTTTSSSSSTRTSAPAAACASTAARPA